jgi:hypothetical protein
MITNKINEAYKILCEVAKEIANNPEKNYKEEILEGIGYQVICEIDNVCMDIRVMSGVSKSKRSKEERVKKYAR